MDSQKDKSDNNGVETPATDLSRRQIIRGMAAVPVVMTLSNGAGAASDSQLRCIMKDQPVVDKDCMKDAKDGPSLFRELSSVYGPAYTDLYDTGDGTPVRAINSDGKYCVVYVTENGVVTDQANGYPVTASCYTSFAPTV